MKRRSAVGAILTLLAIAVGPAAAQVARDPGSASGGGEAARLMQQLQQAAAERTQLQAEVARLKTELEAAQKKPATSPAEEKALRERAQAAETSALRSRASVEEANTRTARLQARYDELVARERETIKSLHEAEAARATLETESRKQQVALAACVDNNAKLVDLNGEVLERLEHTGFWSKVAADEPFTRLKRTELENLADENRAAVAALQVRTVKPTTEASSAPATAAAAPVGTP